jgi:hypothetical protein
MKQVSVSFKIGLGVILLLLCGLLILHFGLLRGRQQEVAQKEAAWQSEQAAVALLTQMRQAQGDVSRFLDVLSTVNQLPQLSAFLSEEAGLNHLPTPAISYRPEKVNLPGLVAVKTSLQLEGRYRDLRKLIDDLERNRYFLVIQDITLSASDSEDAETQLQLELVSYMREK